MNCDKYELYIDDTGNRKAKNFERSKSPTAHDMDWFALGGVLAKGEDAAHISDECQNFCSNWKIDYPLHSSRIRGCRGKFGWLGNPEVRDKFLSELQGFLLSLPVIAIACIVDRAGYSLRYSQVYHNNLWPMPKTVFSILIERAAKFADSEDRKLEIYFEESGKKEDGRLLRYLRELKQNGNPFDETISGRYTPLSAEDYQRIVLGEPHRLTKQSPHVQLADLLLYPLARSGYDPNYQPYGILKDAGKIIDCLVPENEMQERGIKYSCFGPWQK